MADVVTCARHPDVETRLRCSSCETPICPSCGREAAVGFKCPDCAAHAEGTTSRRDASGGLFGRFSGNGTGGRRGGSDEGTGATTPEPSEDRGSRPAWLGGGERPDRTPVGDGTQLPLAIGGRATLIGFAAAVIGGLVLGPVLQGGAFFLISAGVVGWGVARAVYWATEERNSPYVRALAMTSTVLTVAIAMGFAASMIGGRSGEIAFLAYPAALYGGWIVVRQR